MATQASTSARTLKPTKARYWVVVFAVTLAVLSYIDRVAISQAAPVIQRDLGFTSTQMGAIFSAFAVAYAIFEIPGGWMGDWMGARKVLMRIVIWWSAFTAATGYMWSFGSMYVCRFLFGAGEAGCFPNLTKAFSSWLPTTERVRAQGIMWMAARWGGAVTPPLVALTFAVMSWRMAFAAFGAIGIIWAVFFYRWFRDNPKDHKSVNQQELALIVHDNAAVDHGHGLKADRKAVIIRLLLFSAATLFVATTYANQKASLPVVLAFCLVVAVLPLFVFLTGDVRRKLIRSRTIWLLWAQYFFLSYPWYFYITWLPTFLRDRYPDMSDFDRSILAGFPLAFGGVGSIFCGFISAHVDRWSGSIARTRRIMACIGFAGASVMLAVSTTAKDAVLLMVLIGMASFFNDLVMPGAWAACMDVGGKYAGTVSGSMNMMGNLAGFVAPTVGGMMRDAHTDWSVFLLSMAGMYFLGVLCWPFIDPVTPLDAADRT
jgi:MFS transporter, ACS family, glucarate transporter